MERSQKVVNDLVFGGFASASLWRLVASTGSPQAVGHAVALFLIAWLGYRGAKSGPFMRVMGISAFVVGWFWMPFVPLAALLALSVLRRAGRRVPVIEPGEKAPVPRDSALLGSLNGATGPAAASGAGTVEHTAEESPELKDERRTLLRTTLVLKLAAELGARVKRLQEPFRSPYGEGAIPLVMRGDAGDVGIYVDVGPWTWPAQEECLRWLGLLRTSDREDLAIEVHSDNQVPELVTYYTRPSLRTSFELEGLLCMRWRTFGFARQNAATLRQLATKHLGQRFGEGAQGLRALDEFVLEYFRQDRHILPSTVILLGSYLGETLIKLYGGQWLARGEEIEQVVVGLPRGDEVVDVNVFGKVMKPFRNGAEDSTAAMAAGLEDILRS